MPSSAAPFPLLTPLLLMLLGAGQIFLWRMWPKHKGLQWMGHAFISISVGIALQLLWKPNALSALVVAFSVCYLHGFTCIAKALSFRLKVRFDTFVVLVLCAVCMALQLWFTLVTPDLVARVYILNLVSLAIVGMPLLYWRWMRVRNVFDQLLRWTCVMLIVTSLLRLLVLMPHSHVQNASDFIQTWFWMSVHIVCMVLGMLAAAAMFFAVLHDVLEKIQSNSVTDVLTQVLNRRGWDLCMQQRQQMEGEDPSAPYALLMIDLDHFKAVNDTWGHAIGDRVLEQTAQLLLRQVRSHDVVCRYGGEEFVVLLAHASLDVAYQVAQRIRLQMQTMQLPILDDQRVTMSIGVAHLPSLASEQLSRAFATADALLYQAKRAGRNQVAIQPSQPSVP